MAERRVVVQVEVARERAELAADALWRAGPSAVLEVDLPGDRVRLTADVADPALVDVRWSPVVVSVGDDAYLDTWRTWAMPVRAGRRIVLHPAWVERAADDAEQLVVVLDPGRSFGSGSHESTRLAAALLEDHLRPGDRVLDVGCGSGVLAVLACLLGAATATAIDVEPGAVEATLANAATNGVADRVDASTAALHEVPGSFDLVVANIGGAVLWDVAPQLLARVGPEGRVVLSGVVEDRLADLLESYPGCEELARATEGGWVAVVLGRG